MKTQQRDNFLIMFQLFFILFNYFLLCLIFLNYLFILTVMIFYYFLLFSHYF